MLDLCACGIWCITCMAHRALGSCLRESLEGLRDQVWGLGGFMFGIQAKELPPGTPPQWQLPRNS